MAGAQVSQAVPSETEVVAWIRQPCGEVVFDDDPAMLRVFQDLRSLDLRLTGVTDKGLVHLGALRTLRTLNLFRTTISDAGLVHLLPLTALETLLVGGTRMSDQGMSTILALSALK